MPTEINDRPDYNEIAFAAKVGSLVPFLGAAASAIYRPYCTEAPEKPEAWCIGAGFLPHGEELARYLAEIADFPDDNRASDLAFVASYYALLKGDPGLLSRRLREVFEVDCPPGKLHEMIAQIRQLPLVVTTNYDDLIERAFDSISRSYVLVVDRSHPTQICVGRSGDTLEKVDRRKMGEVLRKHDLPVIFKMHGAISRANPRDDKFLITEEDYTDFLGRSGGYLPPAVSALLRDKNLLFLGYGLKDWNVRVLLRKLRLERQQQRRSWAVWLGPSKAERAIWEKNEITVYDLRLQEFVGHLVPELEAAQAMI